MPKPLLEGVKGFELLESHKQPNIVEKKRRSAVPFVTGLQDGAFFVFRRKGDEHGKRSKQQGSPCKRKLSPTHAPRAFGQRTGASGETGVYRETGVRRMSLPRPRLCLLAGAVHETRN